MTVWLNVRESAESERHKCLEEDLGAVMNASKALAGVFEQLGVQPLSAFFDSTDLEFNLGGGKDDLEFDAVPETATAIAETGGDSFDALSGLDDEGGWDASAASWHDAADVLSSAQALADHLATDAGRQALGDDLSDALLDDLEVLLPALREAQALGQPVHLLMVM